MPNWQLPINKAEPQILHIDLNSCFATIEQQARPLLRGKPVAVTNRKTAHACIVAASYEAKALGVKVGMRYSEAKMHAPNLILVETDPPKYHYVYRRLVDIMRSYSPNITMKSIDEGIIDFSGTRETVNKRSLISIGHEIKRRLRQEVGRWMSCNIGIATNRFLAKQAASLHKPDGLDIITHKNLRAVLANLKLTDLFGIAEHNQARLNSCGIYTPLQFLDAPAEFLKRQVFKSVIGEDWYRRLRGYEVDDHEWATKTIGRQYVLDKMKPSDELVRSRLVYLCETTAMKLRYRNLAARGILIYIRYASGDLWYDRQIFKSPFFSNAEVIRRAMLLYNRRPQYDWPREIGISCYRLSPSNKSQLSLLEEVNREIWLTEAIDRINEQYGEFTITTASALKAKGIAKQKIPFGSTRYFELLLKRAD
jgi:DNA polymerase-4